MPARTPPPVSTPVTRYARVAQVLQQDISNGHYAIGERLPTEAELEQRFGVSRHTVRQAIRRLREQGLVTARAGVGTTVTAREVAPKTVLSMNSVTELLQFTESTRLRLLGMTEVTADAALAKILRCRVGQVWLDLELLRSAPRMRQPLGWLHVWIRPEFAAVAAEVARGCGTVFALIEEHYGIELHELQQEISPVGMPPEAARRLDVEAGAPALRLLRHYYDRDGEIPQVSLGYYPEGRFSYTTRLRMGRVEERER